RRAEPSAARPDADPGRRGLRRRRSTDHRAGADRRPRGDRHQRRGHSRHPGKPSGSGRSGAQDPAPRWRLGVTETAVLEVGELAPGALERFLEPWGIEVVWVEADAPIPSSYFGAPEAGIRGSSVFVRPDTPVHSALHEAFHLVCAGRERRATIDTDAG